MQFELGPLMTTFPFRADSVKTSAESAVRSNLKWDASEGMMRLTSDAAALSSGSEQEIANVEKAVNASNNR